MGSRRDFTRRRQRWGGRPMPGGESLPMVVNAPLARAYLCEKWGRGSNVGVKRKPSHFSVVWGGKERPWSTTGSREGGWFTLGDLQWNNSVLGTENVTPFAAAMLLRVTNVDWRARTFCSTEGDDTVTAKSSTFERMRLRGMSTCREER